MSLYDCCLKYCSNHYHEIKDKLYLLPATLRDEIKKLRYKENLKIFRQFRGDYFNNQIIKGWDLSTIEMELDERFNNYTNLHELTSEKEYKLIVHINNNKYLYHIDYFQACNGCQLWDCDGHYCYYIKISTYRQLIALVDNLKTIHQYKRKEGRSLYLLDLAPFTNLDKYQIHLQ